MIRLVACITALCLSCLSITARADFIVTVGSLNGLGNNQIFDAGSRATLWVHASDSNTDSQLNLDTYSLAFRIGNSTAIPDEFSNFSVDFSGGLISNAPPTGFGLVTDPLLISADSSPGHNIVVSNDRGFGNGLVVPGTRTRLFSISFDVATSASGTYHFGFVPDAQSFGGPVNQALGLGFPEGLGTVINAGSTFYNQFTVTAVPEPSSWLLLGLASAFIGCRRQIKRIRLSQSVN